MHSERNTRNRSSRLTVKIADLMSKRVITAQPHHTVEHVREMMNKNRILAVPIVDDPGIEIEKFQT